MDKKILIDSLNQATSSYNNKEQAQMAAELLKTVASDIYSESQRFVFELIQNADDSAENNHNEVQFTFLQNSLIVSHNGKPFSEEDVRSLTTAGGSTKTKDPRKTGYKGIGFKSVFGMSDRVTIFSDGYQFRFDKSAHTEILPWQVIPIWTEMSDLPQEVQQCGLMQESNVSTILELENCEKLEKALLEIISSGRVLLFLRSVSKISVVKKGKVIYSIEKKTIETHEAYHKIQLIENDILKSSWLFKNFDAIPISKDTREAVKNDPKAPEKMKAIENTELGFAVEVVGNKIKKCSGEESLIFTYLPTKVTEFGFPFLVNGSFLTNAPRESINGDIVWNQWLFGVISEKIFDWLELLAGTEFRFQVLHLLPSLFNGTTNELKKAFNRGYTKGYESKAFITARNGSIKRVSEIIYDKTGLSSQTFIDPVSITEFIKIKEHKHFHEDSFIHPELELPQKLENLGTEVFKLDKLDEFFVSPSFTERHDIDQNYDLICYFKRMSDQDSQGIWFQNTKSLPFIYDENLNLLNPETGICFPDETGGASTELGDIPVIHRVVFEKIQADGEIYQWLKKLGVKSPSETAYVSNVIIPGIKNHDFITEENYIQVTLFLLRLFKERKLNDEILETLRELDLKTTQPEAGFVQAQNCYLSNRFNPQLKLENIIENINFVSDVYLQHHQTELDWVVFFKAIRVKDRIEVEVIDHNNKLSTLEEVTDQEWVQDAAKRAEEAGGFGFGRHNVIGEVKFPTLLNNTQHNLEFSKIFWKHLLESHSGVFNLLMAPAVYRYGVGYGNNSYIRRVENYFAWFVKNKNCIPTTLGELYNSQKVYINTKETKEIAGNYFPVFDYDENITGDWKGLFNFKSKLEIVDYLLILEKIAHENQDGSTTRPFITRLGLIYTKLASLLPDMGMDEKMLISDWSKKNQLYCTNEKFENSSDLKFIKIDGFASDADSLKLIHVPSNCKINENFMELLVLLQVQVIDKFAPAFEGVREDFALKSRLEKILPYFAAVVAKRKKQEKFPSYNELFARLDKTSIYQAAEITMSFSHGNKVFQGPKLPVFMGDHDFYFKGKWSSERVLVHLIREMADYLEVIDFIDELGFLLRENDQEEIREWLKEYGVEESLISPRRLFEKKPVTAENENQQSEQPAVEAAVEPEYVFSDEASFNDDDFTIKYNPHSYDMGKVNFSKSTPISRPDVQQQAVFSEIKSQEVREEVGFWSEKFVHKYLELTGKYDQVDWVNQDGESGKPYDIVVSKDGKKHYIDVKGTPSQDKNIIYLSEKEWLFMLDQGEAYSIFRLYGADSAAPEIVEYENVRDSILKGETIPKEIALQLRT